MNKALKKFIYVITVMALLAMMVPAMALPVAAADNEFGHLSMYLIDPISGAVQADEDSGYNVTASRVQVVAYPDQGWVVDNWSVDNIAVGNPTEPAFIIGPGTVANSVQVRGFWGTAEIVAYISNGSLHDTLSVEKKWGQISDLDVTANPGYSPVTWSEVNKEWSGDADVTAQVEGVIVEKDDPEVYYDIQGVIFNWYLIPGNVSVDLTPAKAQDVKNRIVGINGYGVPSHVTFENGLTTYTGVSDDAGQETVTILASGEEAVQVVVVPEYPYTNVNINVAPKVASWAFYTTEMDVVPQVRWAGEKIVLEKNFGDGGETYDGYLVKFSLQNQSVGSLEPISDRHNEVKDSAIWTRVQDGFADVILVSTDPGVANVVAALYDNETDQVINQHFFTVYFLKLESVTLGDVVGKRTQHNAGLWEMNEEGLTNPWDPTGSYNGSVTDPTTLQDNDSQTLNISQDALLRARVRGWFVGADDSWRDYRWVDPYNSNPDNTFDTGAPGLIRLPAGRYVLPDDWAELAGPNWKNSRMHWDIMCNPDGTVGAADDYTSKGVDYTGSELGDYKMPPITGKVVGAADIIGPFSPGLEMMLPTGWEIPNDVAYDPEYRDFHTVVPDGKLNEWDAPMPPAKIIFQIQDPDEDSDLDNGGFFKAADKCGIYYIWEANPDLNVETPIKVYTNPFYQQMIPAHESIPVFINNGGYDWNSFDDSYGPYHFWEFINQYNANPIVPTEDPSGHPTSVEVYSDNHGEAMVYLNGDWNQYYGGAKGAINIPAGTEVGTTTIQATADYPYVRGDHPAFQSNYDVKTWIWGGMILGTDQHQYRDLSYSNGTATRMVLTAGTWELPVVGTYPNQSAAGDDKVVWVWVCDRDGLPYGVDGAKVEWVLANVAANDSEIGRYTGYLSEYNEITENIWLVDGLLENLDDDDNQIGSVSTDRKSAVSYLRPPTPTEKDLFNKFWGNGYTDPETMVEYPATSEINGLNPDNFVVAAIDVQDLSGDLSAKVVVNAYITSEDFEWMGVGTLLYQSLVDFAAADPLDDAVRAGDANCDGVVNMGDVTAVERMILGYDGVTTNAIMNDDGTVDMGTVVKIERTILGLK